MTFDTHDRTSTFCFSVDTENTGSSKPSHELELLQYVRPEGKSIYGCDRAKVYGDVVADLGGGEKVIKVEDALNEFHFERKHISTWINTGMYKQIKKKMQRKGKTKTMTGLSKQMQMQSLLHQYLLRGSTLFQFLHKVPSWLTVRK